MKQSLVTNVPVIKNSLEEPFFICCAGRSGSSHLCLMLNHHSLISCADEIGYITELVSDDGEIPDIEAYREWLKSDRVFFSRGYEINPDLDFHELANDFLSCQQDCRGLQAVGAVSHHNFIRLLRLWPKARFIHLVRDGRDVAFSWMKEIKLNHTAWHAAEHWLKAEQEWDRLAKELSPEQYIEISYEQFVASPKATLQEICQFLNVSYDTKMHSFAREGSYFQYPDPKFIGLWRSRLSAEEVRLAEARAADVLMSRGYTLNTDVAPLSIFDKASLRVRETLYDMSRTRELFGWKFFVLDQINRKFLKSERLGANLKSHRNRILDAQLKR